MKHNRWFNGVVVVVMLALTAMTARQVAAAYQVASANPGLAAVSQAEKIQNPVECPFTPELGRSIHAEYLKEAGHTIPFTQDGPTGVEGGMLAMRYCAAP